MTRKALLVCGIASSLLYVAMNIFVAMQWEGYSAASQTVSELSAIGAPTRSLWVPLGIVYAVLVMGFGSGVWASADRNRPLRVTGALMLVYGIICLAWPPMHQREVLAAGGATLTDTMHLVFAGVTVLLMLLAIGFGAAAFGPRFRRYSIATIVMLLAGGVLTSLDAPRVDLNLPTPWIGVWERINIGLFLVWVMALAVRLLRRPDTAVFSEAGIRSVRATREEHARVLPGDEWIPDAIGSLTHAVTIRGPRRAVWPWLAQMGAGSRAGWYSYDFLDNGRRPSADRVVPEWQNIAAGSLFPARPGETNGFRVLQLEAGRQLVLGWLPAAESEPMVTWAFVLEEVDATTTRLITRARGGTAYPFFGLPPAFGMPIIRLVHFLMARKQLLGIARRVESGRGGWKAEGRRQKAEEATPRREPLLHETSRY